MICNVIGRECWGLGLNLSIYWLPTLGNAMLAQIGWVVRLSDFRKPVWVLQILHRQFVGYFV